MALRRRSPRRRSSKATRQRNAPRPPEAQFHLFDAAQRDPRPNPIEAPYSFARLAPATPSSALVHYWHFAAERQNVFYRRFLDLPRPWTEDPILQVYKFTNAYRASDRVTQYLLSKVIYNNADTFESVFLRVILFKLFNRISTWEYLLKEFEEITPTDFSVKRYGAALSRRLAEGVPIYSAAYMMPSGRQYREKHMNHLQLVDLMLEEQVPARLLNLRRMSQAFDLLVSYPMIGPFLAYQYVIDLNYSPWMQFEERDFVVAGPGALDGIAKCFTSLGDLNPSDVIRLTTDTQEDAFADLGIRFLSLWGRSLQLVDCQNLFCEADKYLRVAVPTARGLSGRTRIKQTFSQTTDKLPYWYPPKWGLNTIVQMTANSASLDALAKTMQPASTGGS